MSLLLVIASLTTVSAQQEREAQDQELEVVLDGIDLDAALDFSSESLEEIKTADAFCFDHNNRMMMLFSDRYEQKVMVWGAGLRYSFLAQVKRGNVKLERVNGVKPTKKALTVWAEFGKTKVRAKSPLYRVTP